MAKPSPRKKAEVRAAYLRGEGGIRELAKRFGIAKSAVERWASDGNWVEERRKVLEAAQVRADERATEAVAKTLLRHRRVAARIAELAEKQLEDGISASKLDTLASVLVRAIAAERLAAGVEPNKPVKVLDATEQAEIIFEIDAEPDEDEDDGEGSPPVAVEPAA